MHVFYFNNLGNLHVKYKTPTWMLLIDHARTEYNNTKAFRHFMLKPSIFILNLDNVLLTIIILTLRSTFQQNLLFKSMFFRVKPNFLIAWSLYIWWLNFETMKIIHFYGIFIYWQLMLIMHDTRSGKLNWE